MSVERDGGGEDVGIDVVRTVLCLMEMMEVYSKVFYPLLKCMFIFYYSGRNLRHISTDKGSGIPDGDLESNSSPAPQNETPTSQDRLDPTDVSTTSTGGTSTPLAPRISLDLLRRRTAQRKDQELAEKYISPEFFPPMGRRSRLLDYLERQDCFKRRMVLRIPEFYVGESMSEYALKVQEVKICYIVCGILCKTLSEK